MASVAAFPSSTNVYVPDTEATGNLRVEFSRNVKDFSLNQYIKVVPVSKQIGYYTTVTVEEAGRVLSDNYTAWPDGAPRPLGLGGTESFKYDEYRCQRHAFDVTLGDLTVEQASWDITQQHLRIKSQQAMTRRTRVALSALTTSGNYASTNTALIEAITGTTGDTWANATTSNKAIQKSIHYAMNIIDQNTLGAVKAEDYVLVLSPALAFKMASTGEISDYLKNSPFAGPVIKGDWAGPGTRGLPERLYGVKVVIENASQTTSKKGATAAKSYIMGNASAVLLARPGSLEGVEGPSFATCTMFSYSDMVVEKIADPINKRTIVSVVDNYDVKMTAPVSGFLFTSCQ